jgi:hypothetical protein
LRRSYRFVPAADSLEGRGLMTIMAPDPVTQLPVPVPLATAAMQSAYVAIDAELAAERDGLGLIPVKVYSPLDPNFLPWITGQLGISDPFPPGSFWGPPIPKPVTVVVNPLPVLGPAPFPAFPWMVQGNPPEGWNPQTGQIDPPGGWSGSSTGEISW